MPQSGRRDHRARTGLRQLHGFRRIGRRRDPADHRLDRGRLRAAVGREVRGAYQRPHARHPDLQPQQSDGVPLYAPRDDADPRSGEALRPFSLFGRSLPRIHLYGVALYLSLPSGGDRAERGADRLGVETLLGVRHPHRGAHHQEPCAARRRDEVLPGAAVAAARGADRRRGVD